MKRFVSAILLSCGMAGTAQADGFCDQIDRVMAQEEVSAFSLPAPFESKVKCQLPMTLKGGIAHHCGWPFAFRTSEARAAFEAMLDSVKECMGEGAEVTTDLGANHPDTYDLKTFHTESGTVRVSLKDKGALQQTYVFLRIEKAPAQ
jgi:hypothetical protein